MKDLTKYSWKVYVRCLTYNHAPYILDTLNGFCKQETDFPFVCTIVDDASSDGAQEVIRRYLEDNFNLNDFSVAINEETDDYFLIFAQHKTNIHCYFAVLFLKYNHHQIRKSKLSYLRELRDSSTYYAMCEGDDYWITVDKLQKQVNFLDTHDDYGMCYSSFDRLHQNNGYVEKDVFKSNPTKFPSRYSLEDFVLKAGYVSPPSWCVRREIWERAVANRFESLDGTYVYFSFFLRYCKVYLFEEVMVVYRILEDSASHTKDYNKEYNRNLNLLNTQKKLITSFGLSDELKAKCIERYYKIGLPKFIANGKIEDVKEARKMIVHKSCRDYILLTISHFRVGSIILNCLYTLKSLK